MNPNRKKTIIAGVLSIIGNIAGILSIVPAIDATDYLLKASANANQVLFGAPMAITLGSCRYYIYHIGKLSDHVSNNRYYYSNLPCS